MNLTVCEFRRGGGGLMRGIKIPPQDFALKMQGGGGVVFARHYGASKSRH